MRVVADVGAIVLSLVAATVIRFGSRTLEEAGPYGWWLVVWVPLWWLGLVIARLYDERRTRDPAEELRRSVYGVTLGAALAVLVAFSADFPLSRGWILAAWGIALLAVVASRRIVRKVIYALHRRGRLRRRALVVGADATGIELMEAVERAPWEGLDVVGFVSLDPRPLDPSLEPMVVGDVSHLREMVTVLRVSDVLVAPTVGARSRLPEVVAALDGVPVDLFVAPGVEGYLPDRLSVQPMGDRPLLAVERIELHQTARAVKRSMDVLLGGLLLLLAAPVIAVCAAAIKVDSPGPVFFRQQRVGLAGRPFRMWKFRSMVVDAESLVDELRGRNEAEGLLFKLKDDPRVTRVGRFLRRVSLDELPQLFNVVAGTMSLVGPRPPLRDEVERYDDRLGRRLLIKPGMTGLWQVSGRHELSFEDYIRFDILYVQNWSVAFDLYILAKTIPAVLGHHGSY